MLKNWIGSGALALLLLGIGISQSSGAERKFEKTFLAKGGGHLMLNTARGSVSVEGSASSEVSIEAIIRGGKKDVESFDIMASQERNEVTVKAGKKSSGWKFFQFQSMDVAFTIRVPKEFNVTIETAGGDIVIRNVNGEVRGETSGGDVKVYSIDGSVTMMTSGGDLNVERVMGPVHMETSGGSISLKESNGDVVVTTSGGDIRMNEVQGKIKAITSGGSVMINLKGENKGITAKTSGGDVDLVVGRNITADIDASSSGGNVKCELPVTVIGEKEKRSLRGKVNGGGEIIHASTSGGNVRIRVGD